MKKNKLFLALFAMVGLCGQGALFAETQALKVGFRQSHSVVMNKNMNLTKSDWKSNVFSQASLFFEADSTDNVEGYISFVVERDWDNLPNISTVETPPGVLANNNVSDGLCVSLGSAYVKMSEFLLSSLSVTVGRQDIVWGSGLVLADGSPNAINVYEYKSGIKRSLALSSPYYSIQNSFDAIKMNVDAGNFQSEFFLGLFSQERYCDGKSRIFKDKNGDSDLLFGLKGDFLLPNAMTLSGYLLSRRTTLESLKVNMKKKSKVAVETIVNDDGGVAKEEPATYDHDTQSSTPKVDNPDRQTAIDTMVGSFFDKATDDCIYKHTFGGRIQGSLDAYIPNFEIEGEFAYQCGKVAIRQQAIVHTLKFADKDGTKVFNGEGGDIDKTKVPHAHILVLKDVSACAGFAGGSYTIKDSPLTPKFSLAYDFRGGDDMEDADKSKTWSPLFYGRPIGHLIDLISSYKDLAEGLLFPQPSGNIHGVTFSTSCMPIESLEIGGSFVYARLWEEIIDPNEVLAVAKAAASQKIVDDATAANKKSSSNPAPTEAQKKTAKDDADAAAKADKMDGQHLGMEFMGHIQWAYSEDSRFIIQGSMFMPQDGLGKDLETACELMTSVVVDF